MDVFTKRVIYLIHSIPPDRVMTYGGIAKVAGNSKGARQISWLLHSMSKKYHLPCHRVINAQGKNISLTGSDRQEMLEVEGVMFDENDRVDLHKYQWVPPSNFE